LTETQGFPASGSRAADVLERIVETKRAEAAALRGRGPVLRQACSEAPPPRDFVAALRGGETVSLIAEMKRRSPGAGLIRPGLDPRTLASDYERAGAAALSVLTDGPWFGGSLDDLSVARAAVGIPVLRKDFMLEEEQILESRAAGADGILLIVRILDDARLRGLRELAEALGMSALVEVHDAGELDRALASGARIVGVNNRDLATFRTSLDTTFSLLDMIPAGTVVVSESGIRSAEDVTRLGGEGVHAVLVGEALLKHADPVAQTRALSACARLAPTKRVDQRTGRTTGERANA
jgi:indole-3-glycerol phosphate synthase